MAENRVFDYLFDYKKYIEQRLKEFSNDEIEERRLARTVLIDGLLNIIEETEKKYNNLEKRVADELLEKRDYTIKTTLIQQEDFDPTNRSWFPVDKLDLVPLKLEYKVVAKAISNDGGCYLGKAYLKGRERQYRSLLKGGTVYEGEIITDTGEFAAKFKLCPAKNYLKAVEKLYRLFEDNNLVWRTVNTAYLERFANIELVSVTGKPADEVKLIGYRLDFAADEALITNNLMAVWNIEEVYYQCSQFPMPSIDSINYEHEFPMGEFGLNDSYLIEVNENSKINGIRYEAGKIFISTPEETYSDWKAYRVVLGELVPSLGYDNVVLDNAVKVSFSAQLLHKNNIALQTKADLYRRINELAVDEYINFKDMQLIGESLQLTQAVESMAGKRPPKLEIPAGSLAADMNWFIDNKIFSGTASRLLLLKFSAVDKTNIFNEAVVRYVISEIQQYLVEYRCLGLLVD